MNTARSPSQRHGRPLVFWGKCAASWAIMVFGAKPGDDSDKPDNEADRQEVRNYIVASELGLTWLGEGRPASLYLIRELHQTLMSQVRGEFASPGEFRAIQNWISPKGSRIQDAAYVPPPPELLTGLLEDWDRFFHATDVMPDLIQCAVLHEQFEAIHPFIDGNGRLGRRLILLFLMQRRRLSQPLLYLSEFLEANRLTYYDLLQRIRTHGDWTSWIHFFLTGVEVTARRATRQTNQLIDLREDFRHRVADKPRALALIDHLFGNPYLTTRRAQRILDASNPIARTAVHALEAAGIVERVPDRPWRQIYVCQLIFDILSGEGGQA
ncbi:MAG: Fic family protein [Chloroflexota bacterium]|nr:Fic family protein [Chloroflexota bacterium]